MLIAFRENLGFLAFYSREYVTSVAKTVVFNLSQGQFEF